MTDDLIDRKIVNYLRKNASNKENQNQIRNKILGLYYQSINGIPIYSKVNTNELIDKLKEFPHYFQNRTTGEILNLFNERVCPRKKLRCDFPEMVDYDIKENNYLEISPKTFRPLYQSDWKTQTEVINNIDYKYQQSFYNYYLKYYLHKKVFPSFDEYLNYIYYKTNRPVHKDIRNIYNNIERSYEPIKDYIKINDLKYPEIKATIIKSTPIPERIKMQS